MPETSQRVAVVTGAARGNRRGHRQAARAADALTFFY
jgi:hypothetical protein